MKNAKKLQRAALPQTLLISDLCAIMHISKVTAHRWLHTGKVPSVRIGRRRLIPREAVIRLLTPPTDPPEAA